jgi:hypothetical protein
MEYEKKMTVLTNSLLGGLAAFVIVVVTVYVCAYVSPVWTVVISALPLSLILVLSVMQRSQIDPGRLKGTLLAYFLAMIVSILVVGTWTVMSFYATGFGCDSTRIWLSLAVCTSVWGLLCVEILLAYFYIPKFKSLLNSGTTKSI